MRTGKGLLTGLQPAGGQGQGTAFTGIGLPGLGPAGAVELLQFRDLLAVALEQRCRQQAGQLSGQHVGEKVVELVAMAYVFRIEQQGPAGAGEQDGGITGGVPCQTEGARQQAFVPDFVRLEAGPGRA